MRLLPIARAFLGVALLALIALPPAGCSREEQPKSSAASKPSAAAGAAVAPDPNAENPDRDSWVDLATKPFDPKLVGGRLVQLRGLLVPSLNAALRPGGSSDVERIHKYLLGAPLLMEAPDLGAGGRVELILHAAAKMPEDSADHRTQVWTLRPDLTWEDGKPVTAKDYAFTFKMIRTPDVDTSLRSSYEAVESIEELDTHRFKVTWKSPQRRAIPKIGVDFQVVPAHAMPADAASFNKVATHLACGPYRVTAFQPGKLIEVTLREEYRTKPFPIRPHYVERFVYEIGPGDAAAIVTRLVNGEAHLVGLSTDQYAASASDPAFRAAAWRTFIELPQYSFIVWNLKDPADLSRPHPVLGDVRVRRALAHLLPLDLLANSAFGGMARPVSGPFDWRDPGSDAAFGPVPFDRNAAAALLQEAGWAPGPDGRLQKEGRPCRLTLGRIRSAPLALIAQTFQEEARRVGVTVDLTEPADLGKELEARRLDAGMLLWRLDFLEPDVTDQWHSKFAVKGGANHPGYADPEVDRLLETHEVTFDPAARAGIRRQIHRKIHEAAPAAFLFSVTGTLGVSRRFANVKIHDLGVRFHDMVLRELWEKNRPR